MKPVIVVYRDINHMMYAFLCCGTLSYLKNISQLSLPTHHFSYHITTFLHLLAEYNLTKLVPSQSSPRKLHFSYVANSAIQSIVNNPPVPAPLFGTQKETKSKAHDTLECFWFFVKQNKVTRFIWVLNPGPSACKADVITTTPMNLSCFK